MIFHGTDKWQNLSDTVSPILHFLALIPFLGIGADFEATILMGLQVNWQWKIEDRFFQEFQDFFYPKIISVPPLHASQTVSETILCTMILKMVDTVIVDPQVRSLDVLK